MRVAMPQATSCASFGKHLLMPVLLTAYSIATPMSQSNAYLFGVHPHEFSRKRETARRLLAAKILQTWFNHLVECFSYKEVQFKNLFPPVNTVVPLLKTYNETHGHSKHSPSSSLIYKLNCQWRLVGLFFVCCNIWL